MSAPTKLVELPAKSSTKARRHARNISRSAERRASQEYKVPMNAVVPAKSLPSRKREEMREEYPYDVDEKGKDIMVPDPRRGYMVHGRQLHESLTKRRLQDDKITRKREARQELAKLDPSQRAMRRAAGQAHGIPTDKLKGR